MENLKVNPQSLYGAFQVTQQTVQIIPKQDTVIVKEPEKKDLKNKLLLALSALAVVGGASVYIYKNRQKASLKDLPFKYNLTEIYKKIKGDEKFYSDFRMKSSLFTSKKQEFTAYSLNNGRDIRLLDTLFTLKEMGNKTIAKTPDIVVLQGFEKPRFNQVSELLSIRYNADLKETKYTKGYLKEFLQTLSETSQKSKNTESRTFVRFENMDEFITDISKPENLELKNSFQSLFKENSDNNITYLTNRFVNPNDYKVKPVYMDFSSGIHTAELKDDLHNLEWLKTKNFYKLANNARDDIDPYLSNGDIAHRLSKKSEPLNVLLFENNHGTMIEKAMNTIASSTNNNFEKTASSSCVNTQDVIQKLKEKLPQSQDLFDRTGKQTYLYSEDLIETLKKLDAESSEFKELQTILADTKSNHLTVVLPKNKEMKLDALLTDKEYIRTLSLDADKVYAKFVSSDFEKIKEKMNAENFIYMDKDSFARGYVKPVLMEKAGLMNAESVANGIMLYGDEEKVNITAQAIKNSLDLNFKEVKFDPDNAFDSIKKLVGTAEKAEIEYQKTGKRTMIEAVEWDKLLIDEANDDSLEMIARFKSFVENVSENYHTTIFLKTSKPLEAFEEASIGSQRFEMKMKIK